MTTLDINTTRSGGRLAAITILGTLALCLAVTATLGAEPTIGGMFTWIGDYIGEVSEALGAG